MLVEFTEYILLLETADTVQPPVLSFWWSVRIVDAVYKGNGRLFKMTIFIEKEPRIMDS